ncbi:DUF2341 domain-containing protein, partial [Patescibacteria group bacterium]|nr:DUF2341 domain-containing protein [Patescibacteria group bacterium]
MVACVLLWSAYGWASIEEETIHIFPSSVRGEGWENPDGARGQELSERAIFSDFSSENSAFVELAPGEEGDVVELTPTTTPASSTTTASTSEEAATTTAQLLLRGMGGMSERILPRVWAQEEGVQEERESDTSAVQEEPAPEGSAADPEPEPAPADEQEPDREDEPAPEVEQPEDEQPEAEPGEPQTGASEGAVETAASEDAGTTAGSNPEAGATSEGGSQEGADAVAQESGEGSEEPSEENPADTSEETADATQPAEGTSSPDDAAEAAPASEQGAETESAEAAGGTQSEPAADDPTPEDDPSMATPTPARTGGDQTEGDTATSVNPTTDRSNEGATSTVSGEEGDESVRQEGSAGTSSGATTSPVAGTSSGSDTVEGDASGGGGADDSRNEGGEEEGGEEDGRPEHADDAATICEVRGTPCRLLEFEGFSIGNFMPDEEIRSLSLRLSLGAERSGTAYQDDEVIVRYRYRGNWFLAGEIAITEELSNARNGGHFLFALPEIDAWDNLDELVVQLEFVRNSDVETRVYLESLWIDATYDAPRGTESPLTEAENVAPELRADDPSQHPDVLLADDERIDFAFTDANDNENLIIKSDRKTYYGLTSATVYFNVTNESERQDDIRLMMHLPDSKGEVTSLKQWTRNVPKTLRIPEYAETGFFCEAGWEPAAGASATTTDRVSGGGAPASSQETSAPAAEREPDPASDPEQDLAPEPSEPAADELGDEAAPSDSTAGTSNAPSDDQAQSPQSSGSNGDSSSDPSDPSDASTATGTGSVAEPDTVSSADQPAPEGDGEREDPIEGPSDEAASATASATTSGPTGEQGGTRETGVESEEELAALLAEQATGSPATSTTGSGAASAPAGSSPSVPPADGAPTTSGAAETGAPAGATGTPSTREAPEQDALSAPEAVSRPQADAAIDYDDPELSNDELLEALMEERARGTTTATGTERARFTCASTGEERWCDSLSEDGVTCLDTRAKIGMREQTIYRDTWMEHTLAPGERDMEIGNFRRLANFFGGGLPRKPVPEYFDVKNSSEGTYRIEPGQTLYFEMEVSYPPGSLGEFWIEAIGKKGSYGLLDPWWDANWQYRIPIEVDNRGNPSALSEYQVYLELDASTTDFWSQVADDGADIRFTQESGEEQPNWLDSNWPNRVPITIQASQIDDDLTNFPVYVDLADLGSSFFAGLGTSTGADIRVADEDGNEVPREVVAVSTSSETGELHFRATTLSSTTDTTYYLYYGNASTSGYGPGDTYGANNVWTSDYLAVYHLEEEATGRGNANLYTDASSNGYNADDEILSSGKDGKVGRGQEIRARGGTSDDHILFPSAIVNGEDQLTFSFWFNSTTTDDQALINGGAGNDYLVFLQNTNLQLFNGSSITLNGLDTPITGGGNWRHVTVARDALADEWRVFVDGVEDTDSPLPRTLAALSIPSDCLLMGLEQDGSCGNSGDATQHMSGFVDEVIFRSSIPSDAEIAATFRNQSTTTDFYTPGPTEANDPYTVTELDHWVQHFNYATSGSATNTASFWVQVEEIPADATTTVYLYFGNALASSQSDPIAPFTHTELVDMHHVVRDDFGGTDTIEVYSMIDNNVVQLDAGATTSLDLGDSISYSSFTATSVVRALGPIATKLEGGSNQDSLVPIGFASTSFVIAPRDGNTEEFFLYAPFGSTTVDVFAGTTRTSRVSIATGTANSPVNAIGDGDAGEASSTRPVLLAYDNGGGDAVTVYPATTRDLYGINSRYTYVGVRDGGTDFEVFCSAGTGASVTGQGPGARYEATGDCTAGADGDGAAVRIASATAPISAIQNADSDGLESTMFWPEKEFATQYMFTDVASYVTVACEPDAGEVNLEIRSATGSVEATGTCTPSGDTPGQAYFGDDTGTNFQPGWRIVSADEPPIPFYAYWEDQNDDDEQNFTAPPQSRQFAHPHPTYAIGARETSNIPAFSQDEYQWYVNEDALPPSDPWPAGPEDLGVDTPIDDTVAVSMGDTLRLRMSMQVQNATTTALEDAFQLEVAETEVGGSCQLGTLSWQAVAGQGSSSAAWRGFDNPVAADGAALSTSTLPGTSGLATYEEENASAVLASSFAPGDRIEFDWALEANAPTTNRAYCFRMQGVGGTAILTPSTYPQLTMNSAPSEGQIISPFDNSKEGDLTPDLEFTAVDAAGDDVHYQVEVDDNFDFSSPDVQVDSGTNPLVFTNVSNPSDKAPFSAGQTIRFTVPTPLDDDTTYYWRVRAIDPDGSNQYGEWSTPPRSFTTDTAIDVSTWFQTTEEQFSTDQLLGVFASTSDDVRVGGPVGEWGTVTVSAESYTEVVTQNTYENPVVVASPRYAGDTVPARSPQVRNKTGESFEIRVWGSASTSQTTDATVVDYIVMEAGDYEIDNGGSGVRVVAGTERNVSGVYCRANTLEGAPATVSFSPAFSQAPVVLNTLASDNNEVWGTTAVDDGSDFGTPPSTTDARLYQMVSYDAVQNDCSPREPEDIDYVAWEQETGASLGGTVEYQATTSQNIVEGVSGGPHPVSLSGFSDAPETYVVAMQGFDGADGGWAVTDTRSPVTASTYYTGIDEDGVHTAGPDPADRGHLAEQVGVVAFNAATGTFDALLTGTLAGTAIDFDDADIGNKWGSFFWSDDQTDGTITYQVQYFDGEWVPIPDADLPGNEAGTTTGSFDLTDLDTETYNEIRPYASFVANSAGDTPILLDWTVEWRQGVFTPTTTAPFPYEQVASSTTQFTFDAADPQGEDLVYEFQISSSTSFGTGTRSFVSDSDPGGAFANLDTPTDTSPFNSGEQIAFTATSGT